MPKRCPDCYGKTSTSGRCPNCRAEHNATTTVDHTVDDAKACARCSRSSAAGRYVETGKWLCRRCVRERLAAETHATDAAIEPAVRWAVGDDDAYPDQDPAALEAGFETASDLRAVADGGQRFEELPAPDRFFQAIGDAEIEMERMDHDEVTFRSQHVPGGRFGFELSASYSYASYDCRQIITLDRDGAEALRDRLDDVLETDRRGAGGEV